MTQAKILICDDEKSIRDSLEMILEFEDYQIELAPDGKAALEAMVASPADAVLLDIKMPGMDGIEVLERLGERWPECPVIMISGHGDVATAVECWRKGAFDYCEKPLDKDRLLITIGNAVKQGRQRKIIQFLGPQILGESACVVRLKQMIRQVAATDARVLILGENGTGKELVARAVHLQSNRASGPFIDVNCAAIPSELIESELFGHLKGSFTGATEDRVGKFEAANGGTIFLDEIGDMSLRAQAKMLRVLEERKLERVGDTRSIDIDARVLAATNKDLYQAVDQGTFRQDLLYRLNVVIIEVPPLRERLDDVPELAGHFLEDAARRNGLELKKLDNAVIQRLRQRGWPGNVRELRNLVERLVILSPGESITLQDFDLLAHGPMPKPENLFGRCETYDEFKNLSEKLYLEEKLQASGWNVKKTAEALQMQRSNLYKKIENMA